MNGYAKYVQFGFAGVCMAAIVVIWQTVIFPSLDDARTNNQALQKAIPEQTTVLKAILTQGEQTAVWQEAVVASHKQCTENQETLTKTQEQIVTTQGEITDTQRAILEAAQKAANGT